VKLLKTVNIYLNILRICLSRHVFPYSNPQEGNQRGKYITGELLKVKNIFPHIICGSLLHFLKPTKHPTLAGLIGFSLHVEKDASGYTRTHLHGLDQQMVKNREAI